MMRPCVVLFVCSTLLAASGGARGAAEADDDDQPAADASLPALNAEQQRAAGIVVAHPVAARVPQRDDAIGIVLDAATLIGEAAEADASAAAARNALTEMARARGLYESGAGASLKSVQAAEAEQTRARAQADVAAAKFATRWRPLAALAAPARQKLLADAAAGRVLLLRAGLPGRHVVGALPERALLDVDGIAVPGRVLGVLGQASEESPGAGVLVEVRDAPAGLGVGARVPVALLGAEQSGVLVPRDAVLYAEGGALVYRQLAASGGTPTRYAPVAVKLLQPRGDSWLVDGIDDDDDIVVHGAGVLWSLQGIIGHAAGDFDDDD
jgi:hypothetical protein